MWPSTTVGGKTGAVAAAITGPAGYLEWTVPAPLRRYLACSWTGGVKPTRSVEPVLPDGCMDIIWDGAHLLVAGPDTAPNWAVTRGHFAVGVRFRPGMGPLFLGVPAHRLCDQRVDLELLWPRAGQACEELAHSSTLRQAAAFLEHWAVQRLPGIETPDPVVEAAAGLWSRGSATAATAQLAERAGVTERHLHRRFVASVGYGPKLLQRVLRFQAFLAACGDPASGLAELAVEAGYADQAHLGRETRALAGLTPTELRTARAQVRNVLDRTARSR
jgi:AraC-like DNA-binding protein